MPPKDVQSEALRKARKRQQKSNKDRDDRRKLARASGTSWDHRETPVAAPAPAKWEVPDHRYKLFNVGFPRAVFLGAVQEDAVPDHFEPDYRFEEPPRKKRCCRENPPQAKFCMECGDPLGIKAQGSTNQDELQIIGFSVEGLEETIEEDDWDALRALVHSKATLAVKQEDENAPLPIEEEPEVVPLEDVWPLQKTISRRFRNGSAQKWWALPKATG